ncbi:heme anaerobic degradation radical SAM methyltransferase ChuW/HutW [Ferrimonas pelagia]|uniref:Radical SAM core domain-containing protein n=1 Tax=Ferrimonas pelagia TaxID=1177826 RepID=A0ABP9EYD8_9GAMM
MQPVSLTEQMTGRPCANPLTGAFVRKETAHIQVMGAPVLADDQAALWQQLCQQPAKPGPRLAYIHIPFCRTRCSYCAFFQNRSSDDKIEGYLNALLTELEMAKDQPGIVGAPFDGIYLGGGTPSDLSPAQILKLGRAIQDVLPLKTDAEITFEARFHGFDDDRFSACLDAGFNRFSLGLQSFHTELRQRLGRIDDGATVRRRLEHFTNQDRAVIVADLIYGLPGQTVEHWQQDLDTLVQTGVGGADLYQLILLPESKLGRDVNKGLVAPPPGVEAKTEMFQAGIDTLTRHHFNRLSVSHWGRDRRERNRYNHLSKAGADLIPFGSGAGGRIAGHGVMTERKLCHYLDKIKAGEKPLVMMTQPHAEHTQRFALGGGFDLGYLDLERLDRLSPEPLSERAAPLFQAWQDNGLAQRDGRYLNLTDAGQFWNINLQQAITAYLDQQLETSESEQAKAMNDLFEQINVLSKKQPLSSLAQVGRQLGLSELATVQSLPVAEARVVDGRHFDRLMAALTDFGPTTTVIEVAGQILEYKGGFPEGSYGHGFYNLKGEHLRGHLNPKAVAKIAFCQRPFMRMETRSIWLFDDKGQCSFKIYLGRDEDRKLLVDQVNQFHALEAEFLTADQADAIDNKALLPGDSSTAFAPKQTADTQCPDEVVVAAEQAEQDVPKVCPISGFKAEVLGQDSAANDGGRVRRCPMKSLLRLGSGK